MAAVVKKEVDKLAEGFQELYRKTNVAAVGLANRLQYRETNYQGNTNRDETKSLLHMQGMLPEELAKDEEWRTWKADVEDYMERFELPTCKHYFDPTKVQDGRECGLHTSI